MLYGFGMSTAEHPSRVRPRLLGLIAFFGLLAWAANAAVLASDEFGYDYTDSVNAPQLVGEMLSISPIDVIVGFFTDPFFAFMNLAMLGSVMIIAVAEIQQKASRAVVILTVTVVSVPMGALALVAMLSSFSAGLDGEWLGESWPIFEAMFFWSMALCLYSAPDLVRVRSGRSSSATSPAGDPLSRAGQAEGFQL